MDEKKGITDTIGGLEVKQIMVVDAGLAVHSPIELEIGLEKGKDVMYHSVSPISNTGPIEFFVPQDNECFFALNQTRISGSFIVEATDGKSVLATDNISLVNHFAACLFSQVEVYLNSIQICDLSSANSYPWKMFIQTLLSYNKDAKKSHLITEGFYLDNPTEANDSNFRNLAQEIQPGLYARKELILNKKKVYFDSRLGVDLFNTVKFLPPNIDINIRLTRNHDKFGLLYNSSQTVENAPVEKHYRIVLQDLKLRMRKIFPTLAQRDVYFTNLSKEPALLPYKSIHLRHFTLPQGLSSYPVSNIVTNILPKSIIFCMIDSKAMPHDPLSNPFNFQHFKITSFNVTKSGENILPKAYEMDFENDDIMTVYQHMYEALDQTYNNGCGITLEEFKNGKTFFPINLNPDKCNGEHTHMDQSGNIDVEIKFAEPLKKPIYLYAYMVFNSAITINSNLQVKKAQN